MCACVLCNVHSNEFIDVEFIHNHEHVFVWLQFYSDAHAILVYWSIELYETSHILLRACVCGHSTLQYIHFNRTRNAAAASN